MKLSPVLVRPWLKAGLTALLVEDEARVLALRAVEKRAEDRPNAGAMPNRAVPQSGNSFRAEVPASGRFVPPLARGAAERPAGPAAPVPPSSAPAARPVPQEAPAGRPAAPARPAPPLMATPGALPPERWPAAWRSLKDRRPLPPRPLVLWTYAGLGDDLTGTPDEARRRVVVRMLTALNHPAGTHVFWPFALSGDTSSPEASLFWSGVKMLDPRVILLFGSDTRDALEMPKTLKPFGQARVYGRLIVQLPRPQALAEDDAAFRQVQAFLARMLRFCASR